MTAAYNQIFQEPKVFKHQKFPSYKNFEPSGRRRLGRSRLFSKSKGEAHSRCGQHTNACNLN